MAKTEMAETEFFQDGVSVAEVWTLRLGVSIPSS